VAKDNQPTLVEDVRDFFEDPDAEREEWDYAKQPRHPGMDDEKSAKSGPVRRCAVWFAPQ
jgi:hypothetical protein